MTKVDALSTGAAEIRETEMEAVMAVVKLAAANRRLVDRMETALTILMAAQHRLGLDKIVVTREEAKRIVDLYPDGVAMAHSISTNMDGEETVSYSYITQDEADQRVASAEAMGEEEPAKEEVASSEE